ncbi:acetylglucosamine transferase [Bradyrhizobium sacchari]|uniref:protein O-GlcNAc transferase n=1 Tax=Bradyrhizobium sacchari TaxID=1399419 RepID=A0A560KKJ3_9BRAD|nr:glycosyltransferase family 41 protein [Bradyrhizobium sacchari]OPY95713.1 acetylglucosamine transferase [Bradyrhizobium sacchari]TWB66569.1 putative O-linked N-acetylglucosamine transferase (SPINDLY family) [Bradyrhizobium sacchari]TWB83805.1 putative O-linked N-acetylglucosamine transferase (SPINDLY family) [Bradyrhizobium sacchari]
MQSSLGARVHQNARLQQKLREQADAVMSFAIEALGQGRRDEAENLCREILKEVPDHFHATHLLGLLAFDGGWLEDAQFLLERATMLDPRSPDAHSNLGAVYFALEKFKDARACQEKAIALKPDCPITLTNLGNTMLHLGQAKEAIELHERAIRLKPDYADAFCNCGMAQLMIGQFELAGKNFDRALSIQPRHAEAIAGKGMVSLELRHYEAAEAAFDAALTLKPGSPRILVQRGRLYLTLYRLQQAAADFDAVLAQSPRNELALCWRAQVDLFVRNTTGAIAAAKTLLEVNPQSEAGMSLLAYCHANQGDVPTALEYLDAALAIAPDFPEAIGYKIFVLDYLREADFAVQQAARKYWWDQIGARLPQRSLSPRDLDPERQIVIGYVASEFRQHSAAYSLFPVLRHHDHAKFKIVCYSCWPLQDGMTEVFKSCADVWVEAAQFSDDELADRIQADGIDILIDVSGHTTGNRLNVFSRKPAPIQVTGFGHATGTGLQTMDYVFADPIFIPQSARHLLAEKVYDLPCLITIDPILDVPPSELPMLRNGYVTFGVFNRIYKISDEAIRVWSKVMREVAGSKIIIKHNLLDDPLLRDGLIARFVAQGVAEENVICMGTTPRNEHLRAFANVDISLDTFPQNGGISTWESLYAGVPVVAQLGKGSSSRAGGSIVAAVGLDDWIAADDEGYAAIAIKYATQPAHLAKLRADLPARIAASPAGNVEIYTRKVEAGYRQFWRDYCASASGSGEGA